jgi:2'-5' RNA ligase
MRLFVAIDLGEQVLDEAAALIRELRRRQEERYRSARVTWIPLERMHLTIRFIGEAAEEKAAALLNALRAPIDIHVFEVHWQGLGSFPPRGAPRVLWAGARSGREELLELERHVTERLTPVGVTPEDRPYSPHLTLARVREAGGMRASTLFDGIAERALGDTRVDAITLFESKLSPKGPTYVRLLQSPLRGREG